ncbi:MAG: hypothetical protein AB7E24_16655 [Novosphingobium sp.]
MAMTKLVKKTSKNTAGIIVKVSADISVLTALAPSKAQLATKAPVVDAMIAIPMDPKSETGGRLTEVSIPTPSSFRLGGG